MMKKASKSVLVIPFPAQGHVNSLINLSYKLAQNGFNVIFVNSEFIHNRMLTCTTTANQDGVVLVNGSKIRFVSIPDGLDPEHDRNDFVSLFGSMLRTMPVTLEKLIGDLSSEGDDVTCVIADGMMGWAVEVASKLRIKTAAFWMAAAALFAVQSHIPKLIHDGIVDCGGFPLEKKTFQLSPNMPIMETQDIFWNKLSDSNARKSLFDYITRTTPILNSADWWLCNTTYKLEPHTLSFIPKLQPIGPLLESHNYKERPLGNFWEEDMSCLNWLDQHPPCSVIYVAFGSFAAFDSKQFQEIALGLKLTNRPFLWVVREDSIFREKKEAYPYDELKGNKGKIVNWAPQWDVLNHPSIACFISHCGWNSTVDGLSNGVPFLCWPNFADQFLNKTYMCGEWKVGLGFECDENGIVSSGEIKKKVEDLLSDGDIRARSLKMKEVVMNDMAHGGHSCEIFNKFVEWLKE